MRRPSSRLLLVFTLSVGSQAVFGCGLVLGLSDYEDEKSSAAATGSGGAGGTGAAGVTSSAGAASSVGGASSVSVTGTGGSVAECPMESVCVPTPPNGWKGPSAVYVGTDPTVFDCGPAWNDLLAGNSGMVTGEHTCTACGCNPPTGAQCSVPKVTVYGNGQCTGTGSVHFPNGGGACTDFGGGYGVKADPSLPTGGNCTTVGGDPDKAPVVWDLEALICSGPVSLPACPGGTCAPPPAAPFGATFCVYKDGEEPGCPLDYPTRTVVYRDVADTRACTACGCGSASGITCPSVVTAYGSNNCTGTAYPLPGDALCQLGGYYQAGIFTNAPVGGTCPPVGGVETGGVAPSLPVTVCCALP